jgi:CheY-like chemotaxis protein
MAHFNPIQKELVILLLEDDLDQQDTFREILTHLGHVVLCASTLKQARDILQEHNRNIDHVLSDNHVDHSEAGLEMKQICAKYEKPCLVFSGLKTPGVDMEKPLNWGDLWEYLRSLAPTVSAA